MWNYLYNNRFCYEFDLLRSHREHLERLLLSKSNINNTGPSIPKFLSMKLSNKHKERVNKFKIAKDNMILFNKLCHYSNSKSPYSKDVLKPKNAMKNNFVKIRDYKRLNIEKKIQYDNIKFYKRFSNEKTHYPLKNFLEKSNFEKYIRYNMHKNFVKNPSLNFVTYDEFKTNLFNEIKNKIELPVCSDLNINYISNNNSMRASASKNKYLRDLSKSLNQCSNQKSRCKYKTLKNISAQHSSISPVWRVESANLGWKTNTCNVPDLKKQISINNSVRSTTKNSRKFPARSGSAYCSLRKNKILY